MAMSQSATKDSGDFNAPSTLKIKHIFLKQRAKEASHMNTDRIVHLIRHTYMFIYTPCSYFWNNKNSPAGLLHDLLLAGVKSLMNFCIKTTRLEWNKISIL